MSGIFGILNLADNDRSFVNTIGQRVVYDAVSKLIAQFNADMQAAYSVFVGEVTSDFKRRYKLPGGGYLQRRGGLAPSAAVKATGQWDIALPLEDFGASFADSDIALAYMNIQDLNRHLDTITAQSLNTTRREILKGLFNNTVFTFKDPINGDLLVQPLANGDAVLYPPVQGSDLEASENHYLASGYAASAISDTNNPFPVIREELEQHFGANTGGENIVCFINPAQVSLVESLSDFDEVNDRYVIPGANVDTLTGLPASLPGRIIGRSNGCWIVEWRWVPADYILATYMEPDVPKPLIMRVDPADTGLTPGLALVARDQEYPLENSNYRNRFGIGVGNRLNGLVMQLTTGSYATPPGYLR